MTSISSSDEQLLIHDEAALFAHLDEFVELRILLFNKQDRFLHNSTPPFKRFRRIPRNSDW